MLLRPFPVFLLVLVVFSGLTRADTVLDAFDATGSLAPNPDGGHAPEIRPDPEGRVGSCVRLVYRHGTPGWGNVRRALTVPATSTGIRFWLRVNSAAPSAAMHIWLLEKDGDGYLVRVRVDNKELHEVGSDWHEVTLLFPTFGYRPRGDGKRRFLSIDTMLFGCNFGDLDVSIDELRLVQQEVTAMPLPRTPDLSFPDDASVRAGILTEPTFERRPSHADPARLQRLLEEAGVSVTMLRAGDVCDPKCLTSENVDVLVVPCAPLYPREGKAALRSYLKSGGSFLSLGGYAFDEIVEYSSGGWSVVPPAVTAADMDAQKGSGMEINTRFGKPGDTMRLDREQIGVFDPSYELRYVRTVRSAPAQYVCPAGWSTELELAGFAAVAMTGSNSPVFPDVYGRWIPLIDCADEFGRSRGPVGALVHNYDGPYAKASWAFFGVTNLDLFDGRDPELDRLFVNTVRQLAGAQFLHELSTDLACYRQGEEVTLRATVSTRGKAPERMKVRFEIDGRSVATAVVPDSSGDDVAAVWAPGTFGKDFYRVRAILEADGQVVDEMETGFVVWDEDVLKSGPSVALVDNYMQFRGQPTFLTGCNQTGMMWYSANENPLVWNRDFEKMNDCAQNMLRVLHFSPFARENLDKKGNWSALDLKNQPLATQRKTDAIVQLAQKHNVILFLTLHDWMPVALTDEELEAQREWAEFWAARYRDVPGMVYDVQNEPRVTASDNEDVRKLSATWLTHWYGSLDEAEKAWRESGASEDAKAKAPEWQNLQARDLDLLRIVLFDRWTKANGDGLRSGDPDALLTVGHLQHLTAADKLLGATNLDFTNTHFYGSIPDFRRKLKMIDRRFEGKSFSLGEFGSRIAHTARGHGQIGDPADESVAYYLAVGHYSLGMGASFIANWDWKDFQDCVFPWGINHPDLVSKPVLEAYRNMALFFRVLRPRYESPDVYLVVPDSHRFGARSDEIHNAILHAVSWLLDCNIPFGVINDWDLAKLPPEAKALVWMLPYCPNDQTFQQVTDFVRAGGKLCFSGDVRFGPRRKPDRDARLPALELGADFEPVPPFSDKAKSLPREAVWSDCGHGQVCWIPFPLELDPHAPGRELYSRFLEKVGVSGLKVSPGDGSVHAFEIPTTDGRAVIAYNDSQDPIDVKIESSGLGKALSMRLDANKAGLVAVDSAGAILAAEAQGGVQVGGREVFSAAGNHAVVSLDGKDIAESGALLALPYGRGRMTFARSDNAPVLTVETGEFRRAVWTPLGETSSAESEAVEIPVPESSAYDLRLLAAEQELPAARVAAQRFLLRSAPMSRR